MNDDEKNEDINEDENEGDSVDTASTGDDFSPDEGEDSLDFGSVNEEGEGDVDEGFMDEVNSLDEFGSDSPSLSKEETIDALQAITEIANIILATEGVTDGEQPTSEEVNFVLDEVQDLAAGFDKPSDADDGTGEEDLSALPAETEPLGEFDEEGFDEGVEEEFPEEIEASLVRVMVAGKPVRSRCTRPVIGLEDIGGVPALLCSGVGAVPNLDEEDEPAADAVFETAVLNNGDSKAIQSKFTKVGSFKKWVMQSKAHKLAWRIASSKYRRLVKQSAKTPREKAAVFFLANSLYNKVIKSSGNKLFKTFSGKSPRAIRKVSLALSNRKLENKSTKVLFSDYNGYRNYETWNASLYITKDEALNSRARRLAQSGVRDYDKFIQSMGLAGKKTPDGVEWSSSKIDRGQMGEVLSNLTSSVRGGSGMNKRPVRSATQADKQGDLVTVQDDTKTGVSLSGQTLSDSAIEDSNTERVLNVDGGDTSQITDVNNTGDDGDLVADLDAGTEVSASEYGFDNQEMVGVELPIENENQTQVLEMKSIGSGVYILQQSYISPGAGRLSFTKGKEAAKIISRNTRPAEIKANVNRVLSLGNTGKGLLLRSSPILGIIAIEAPYQKGLKNSEYSVFSRVGVNLINEKGYYIPQSKGAKNFIASASSMKGIRRGSQVKNLFSEVEGAYVGYLKNKVYGLIKQNKVLRASLDKSLKAAARDRILASQALNKEQRSARQHVASAMQSLNDIKKQTAEAEAQRVIASSASAVRENALNDKARTEANTAHLLKMMRW